MLNVVSNQLGLRRGDANFFFFAEVGSQLVLMIKGRNRIQTCVGRYATSKMARLGEMRGAGKFLTPCKQTIGRATIGRIPKARG